MIGFLLANSLRKKRSMPDLRFPIARMMLLTFLIGSTAAGASSAPTPVPGGTNQRGGVEGTLSQTLFNGVLRLRAMSLKDAEPGGKMRANRPEERPLVFRAIVSNGLRDSTNGYFDAMIADANGITVTGLPLDEGWDLQQGAATRTTIGFSVPADFVPTKIVLTIAAAPKARAFRIMLRPSDLATQAPVAESPVPQ
jgi:hypothetical protein